MADEQQPEVQPLHFTQHVVITVDEFPKRTAFSEEFLATYAYVYHATVDGDTVTFTVANGTAVYQLRRDLDDHGTGIMADLVSADPPSKLGRAKAKFERVPKQNTTRSRLGRI